MLGPILLMLRLMMLPTVLCWLILLILMLLRLMQLLPRWLRLLLLLVDASRGGRSRICRNWKRVTSPLLSRRWCRARVLNRSQLPYY